MRLPAMCNDQVRVTFFGSHTTYEPAKDSHRTQMCENVLLGDVIYKLADRCGERLRMRTGGGPNGSMGIAERAVGRWAYEHSVPLERVYYGATTEWLCAFDRPSATLETLPKHIHWIESDYVASKLLAFNGSSVDFQPPVYPLHGTRAEQLAVRQRHVIGPSPHIAIAAPGFYGTLYEATQVLAEAVHGNYPYFHGLLMVGAQWKGVIDALEAGRQRGRSNREFPLIAHHVESVGDAERFLDRVLPRLNERQFSSK